MLIRVFTLIHSDFCIISPPQQLATVMMVQAGTDILCRAVKTLSTVVECIPILNLFTLQSLCSSHYVTCLEGFSVQITWLTGDRQSFATWYKSHTYKKGNNKYDGEYTNKTIITSPCINSLCVVWLISLQMKHQYLPFLKGSEKVYTTPKHVNGENGSNWCWSSAIRTLQRKSNPILKSPVEIQVFTFLGCIM